MLAAIRRWIAGAPPGPDWSGMREWAVRRGHSFKRARDVEGFVIDGAFGDRAWRLEWGPPQRTYIPTRELRMRMELGLPAGLQMLVLSLPLMETLERETFERYTEPTQTHIDVSSPEEMRWLAMFPRASPALSKPLRSRFGAVASEPKLAVDWIDGSLAEQLETATQGLLPEGRPFVLMTLRGRVYMRLQLDDPQPVAVAQAVALFDVAAQAALRVVGVQHEHHSDWQSTGSTAWQTQIDPEPPADPTRR